MSGVFDPGLQPERTGLAWRRTALALLAGSVVAARILEASLGPWAAAPGLVGIGISVVLLFSIHRRYRHINARLAETGDRAPIADGRLIAATALFVACAAAVALALTLAIALHPVQR